MKLQLKIISGPRAGDEVTVTQDIVIGRSRCDWQIRDPKASTSHAKIEFRPGGLVYLVDLGSSNGTRVNDMDVTERELTAGDKIKIGGSIIEVVSIVTSEKDLSPQQPISNQTKLLRFLKTAADTLGTKKVSAEGLVPSLRLDFIYGIQYGTSWLVSTGPRKVGAGSSELYIEEQNAPDICFELHPDDQGIRFFTSHSGVVLLNNHSKSSEILKDGDLISIINTKIRVSFTA